MSLLRVYGGVTLARLLRTGLGVCLRLCLFGANTFNL